MCFSAVERHRLQVVGIEKREVKAIGIQFRDHAVNRFDCWQALDRKSVV